MSKRKSQSLDELPLFDLPLHANDEEAGEAAAEGVEGLEAPAVEGIAGAEAAERDEVAGRTLQRPSEPLTLFPLDQDVLGGTSSSPPAVKKGRKGRARATAPAAEAPAGEAVGEVMEDTDEAGEVEAMPLAPLGQRFVAGGLDFGIQLLVLSVMAAAVSALGVRLSVDVWMPFALLGLVFSFLYWFIPLAFWGQTPGMAWVGSTAVSLDDEPLTFAQTALRWCGALLTLALAGLPILLALGGRSLTDRLSESKTVSF